MNFKKCALMTGLEDSSAWGHHVHFKHIEIILSKLQSAWFNFIRIVQVRSVVFGKLINSQPHRNQIDETVITTILKSGLASFKHSK